MSEWIPPERALDNLPAEFGPPDPIRWDLDRAGPVRPLYRIKPLSGPAAARLRVEVDRELAAREAGLSLDGSRPLLGFWTRAAAGPGLATEQLFDRQDPAEVALLALDLGALLALDPARLAAAADPRADAVPLLLSFTLAQSDRRGGGEIRRAHRLRLEIAREAWRPEHVRVDIRFGPGEAARTVSYPRPNLGDAPAFEVDGAQMFEIARIVVRAADGLEAPPPSARPLDAPLKARLRPAPSGPRGEGAAAIAAELGLRDEDLRVDPPNARLSPDPSGDENVSIHAVLAPYGPNGLREPDAPVELELLTALDLPAAPTLEPADQAARPRKLTRRGFRLAPDETPPGLQLSILDPGDPKAGQTVTLDAAPAVREVALSPVALTPGPAAGAPMDPLIGVELALTGKAAGGLEVEIDLIARLIAEDGKPLERPPIELKALEAAPDRASGRARADQPLGPLHRALHLAAGARQAVAALALERSEAAFEAELGDLHAPGRAYALQLDLQVAGAVSGALRISREVAFRMVARRPVLALDLGGAAVAAALTDAAGAPRLIPLGRAMAALDPDQEETSELFLDSALAVDAADEWRAARAPETLWRADPTAGMRVDPVDAARGLRRGYAVALPAPSGPPAGPRLALAAITRPASAARIPLERPVWSRETEPDPTRALDPEQALKDALHELADRHLTAAGRADDAFGAEVALVVPTRATARQRARLGRAAAALAARLGRRDAAAPRLISETTAALADHLDRLPADGRPTVRAALYDLGAASLEIAVAEAERLDPRAGSRVRRRRVEAVGGAELGADAVDLVLYFTIAEALRALADDPDAPVRLRADPLAASDPADPRAGPPRARAERLAAKAALIRALRRAKREFAARCRAASPPGGYGWPSGETFRVQVGVAARSARGARAAGPWPVVETEPGALRALGDWPLGPGAALRVEPIVALGGPAETPAPGEESEPLGLFLHLTRAAAADRPAMRELVRVLTRDALRVAFRRSLRCGRAAAAARPAPTPVEPADYLIVSGRGALWPPIYEALAALVGPADAAVVEAPFARAFAHPDPERPEALKAAVVRGAARLAERATRDDAAGGDADAPESPDPDHAHYAVLVTEPDAVGGERLVDLVHQDELDRLRGAAGQIRLMIAPPTLTLADLDASIWNRGFLLPTGVAADTRNLALSSGGAIELAEDEAGERGLFVGGAPAPYDADPWAPAPSLHRGLWDVTERHAPPGYPASVRLETDPDAARAASSQNRQGAAPSGSSRALNPRPSAPDSRKWSA